MVLLLTSTVIGVALVGLAIQGLIAQQRAGNSTLGGESPILNGNQSVILNTVDYAERAVNARVLVPETSALGNGYRIVGVKILLPPQNDTTDTGVTWRHWILEFVISNQPFVNGTTSNSALYSTAVTVGEASSPSSADSYGSAVDFMAPRTICHTPVDNSSVTCSTVSESSPYELVRVKSTYIVVDRSVPNALFEIDGVQRSVTIYAKGLTYQQMMSLVNALIP